MIVQSDCVKRYRSANERFLKRIIMRFFQKEFPKFFGPVIREKLADELLALFERNCPPVSTIRPGQLLWNALDKNTRGDSPYRQFVPVILSVVTPEDIDLLTKGSSEITVARNAIARVILEAYQQGGILSNRDIALFTLRSHGSISKLRITYEKEHNISLPHTGALHDMGSTITHKAMILKKIIIQKKDPSVAAQECHHSQRAVDRYLKDYHRVKTMYEHHQDIVFIHQVTGIAKHVVKQYITIIQNEHELNSTI